MMMMMMMTNRTHGLCKVFIQQTYAITDCPDDNAMKILSHGKSSL